MPFRPNKNNFTFSQILSHRQHCLPVENTSLLILTWKLIAVLLELYETHKTRIVKHLERSGCSLNVAVA